MVLRARAHDPRWSGGVCVSDQMYSTENAFVFVISVYFCNIFLIIVTNSKIATAKIQKIYIVRARATIRSYNVRSQN